MNHETINRTNHLLMRILTAVYAVVLVFVLLVGGGEAASADWTFASYVKAYTNLVPFATLAEYARRLAADTINVETVVYNVLGSIALFVPLGVIMPFFFEKLGKLWRCAAASLGVSFVIELLQLVLRCGSFDIDDMILNVVGAAVGYAIFFALKKIFSKESASTVAA